MKPARKKITIILSGTLVVAFIVVVVVSGRKPGDGPDYAVDPSEAVGFLTSEEIPAILANGRPTMIEFGGRSCIPCKQMQPILAELKAEYAGSIDIANFYLEDDEDDYSVTDSFQIMLMPTQVIFGSDGMEIARHVGFWQKQSVVEQFQNLGIMP
ncbi:thioredoxin family protein [Gemmatimonadota bacterium]